MDDMANTSDTSTKTAAKASEEEAGRNANRSTTPSSEGFKEFIGNGWADRDESLPSAREQAAFAAARRAKVSGAFTGIRLIVPAGDMKQRANDTDYPFRAHSAFTHLTGWGSDSEPGAVLVFEPDGDTHTATVYFRERAGRDSEEFYANPSIGEFWIGARPSLEHVAADLAIATSRLEDFDHVLAAVDTSTLVLREADASVTERVDHARIRYAAEAALSTNASDAPFSIEVNSDHDPDGELARVLSELRLVKDAFEVAEMRAAIDATQRGFTEVIDELRRITATRARLDGNDVGYGSIAAAGPHATILHWTRNDGPVVPGDLVLLDAGVERDSYYTADITRTFPVNGTFSDVQRRVYEAVLEAADAAFAVVRPGAIFREVHAAAMEVIAGKTAEWGFLPVSAEESLQPENQFHRRYMVHGTSHHLGLDVHDCAHARRSMYMDGVLEPGMLFTIEPGLYFQPDDLTVPVEFRGIGVRIEDDILVTADGAENLSAAIPRTADEVEAWVRGRAS
jgi:Xaa-Pro aminopeptidase